MSRAFEALTLALARTLDPAEREVALGDLAEAGEHGARAAAQVFGLVARRQLELWKDWPPRLAAVVLTIPSVLILSGTAARMSHLGTIYGWMYFANWDPIYLTNPGARSDFLHYGGIALACSLALATWSWATGFAAGSLSQRSAPAIALLASAVLFAFEPGSHGIWFGPNDAAFASLLGVLAPIVTCAALVMAPALAGLGTGARLSVFQGSALPATHAKSAWRPILLAVTLATTMVFDWLFRYYRLP